MGRILLLIYSVTILIGCISENGNANEGIIKDDQYKSKFEQQIVNNKNDCAVAKNIDSFLEKIISNPNNFINGKENEKCVLSIIDTLNLRAIKTNEKKYLKAIESICNVSDGYVSEYFLDIGVDQFYQNFNNLIDYIYQQNKKNEYCLRKVIIEAISMQLSDGGKKKEKEVEEYIEFKIIEYQLPREKIDFVRQMQKEFDASMFK